MDERNVICVLYTCFISFLFSFFLFVSMLSLMNTRAVWAHGLVPGHSDPSSQSSSAAAVPAVEDYDYDGSYDYDGAGHPLAGKTGGNSTRYYLRNTLSIRRPPFPHPNTTIPHPIHSF